jgi:hypothetical protein
VDAEIGVDELVYAVSYVAADIRKKPDTDTPCVPNTPSGYVRQGAIGFERCELR